MVRSTVVVVAGATGEGRVTVVVVVVVGSTSRRTLMQPVNDTITPAANTHARRTFGSQYFIVLVSYLGVRMDRHAWFAAK